MNATKFLHQTSLLGLILLVLIGCSAPATPATPTPVPPTVTPTSIPFTPTPTGPKVGHWQGNNPSVSFDITSDGNISNFRITVAGFITPQSSEECIINQADKENTIDTDGSFIFAETYPASKFDENTLGLLKSLGGVEVTKSPSGDDVVETMQITGKFSDVTTITGNYKVLKCGKVLKFQYVEGRWSAKSTD